MQNHRPLRRFPFGVQPSTLVLIFAIATYALLFSHLTLTRYAAFESRALDMGNLNQAIWNTAHGNWFHLTNQPGTINRLSLHVEPIILPIAGLYRLYLMFVPPEAQIAAGPRFLVVLQSVVVALGAWPVFLLARRLPANAWVGVAFGVAYLLNPSIQAANWLEFHPVTLAPTFLIAAFYCLVVGRIRWFALFAILAASCKEEIGLLVFMIGLYAFVFLGNLIKMPGPALELPAQAGPRRMRRVGAATMCLALAWSLTAVLGIQNLFADGNIHWGRYGYLGDSPLQMVWALVTRPGVVWAQLESAGALRYLHELWAPVGYLPLLAPHIFLLALPSLGINLLADFPPMHQVNTLIYAAPVMPFAVLAAILGAARLRGWVLSRPGWSESRIAAGIGAGIAMLVLVAALVQHRAHGYLPTGGNHRLYTVTDHHRRAANILAQIPPQAAVSAQDKLNPHVSGRETVYIFPRINGIGRNDANHATETQVYPQADMIWVDVTGPAWPLHPSDLYATVQELLAGDYGIAAGEDGYLLLARNAPAKSPPPEFYSAWHGSPLPDPLEPSAEPAARRFVPLDFGDKLRLLDYAVSTDAHGELVTRLTWQALAPPAEALGFFVAYRNQAGQTLYDTEFYPPVAQLWYPTEMWSPDTPVHMQTLPWTLDDERFGLYVGVYRRAEEGPGRGALLPVSENNGNAPLFEHGALARLGGFELDAQGRWQAIEASAETGIETIDAARRDLDAVFGGQIALRGAEAALSPTGDGVAVTLAWEALEPVHDDYTVFVHILDRQDRRVAQLDDQPRDAIGPRPMSGWLAGERLLDRRTLTFAPEDSGSESFNSEGFNMEPGELRAQIGVYHWQDGARLPVSGDDAQPGNLVEIYLAE